MNPSSIANRILLDLQRELPQLTSGDVICKPQSELSTGENSSLRSYWSPDSSHLSVRQCKLS
eukprot:3648812-Rhodomonas_salina.1